MLLYTVNIRLLEKEEEEQDWKSGQFHDRHLTVLFESVLCLYNRPI